MTFTEAAVHVLRLVGKPLHYKEITDVAIEKDLLSHVGKSPEVTMGARLAAIVKKGSKETPLTRIKPGVFALSEWDEATVEQGLQDRTPALKRIAERIAQGGDVVPGSEASADLSESTGGAVEESAKVALGQDEIARAELTAAATELFAAEEDDDEPILGSVDEEDDDEEEDEEVDLGGKRRRRRRRGRARGEHDDLPAYTVSDASEETVAEVTSEFRKRENERGPERNREGGERNREGGERNREGGERSREGGERSREGGERSRDAGERSREGGERNRDGERGRGERSRDAERNREGGRDAERSRDGAREPREEPISDARLDDVRDGRADELLGGDLADLVAALLADFRRQGGATARQIAELAVRKGRAAAADGHLTSLITAACHGENFRKRAAGERERFRTSSQGRIALSEWSLDRELLRLEKEVQVHLERYQTLALQRLTRRISELPSKAIGELVLVLLQRMDYADFQLIRRPGAHPAELHLSAVQRTPLGDARVAIVVRRDGRDIGRERVTELRGSLHHYGRANSGLLITTGQVMSGAREEAAAPGATPMSFVDGAKIAQLCEQSGVGVVRSPLSLFTPDAEFFDSLRAG